MAATRPASRTTPNGRKRGAVRTAQALLFAAAHMERVLTPAERATAREVMGYFLRNPQPVDVEDVARWRLEQDAIDRTVDEVNIVLAWLERKRFLIREEAPGIKPLFKLNPESVGEVRRFIGEPPAALVESAHGVSDLIARALAWVDSTLLRHHLENPPAAGDPDGQARSRAFVESALRARVRTAPEGDEVRPTADEDATQLQDAFDAAGASEPLSALRRALRLAPLELQALLLALAPELDAKYQLVYVVLNDEVGRRAATLGLIGAVLGEGRGIRNALSAMGGLTRWRLFQGAPSLPYADEAFRLDPAVLAWLLGDTGALAADPRLRPILTRPPRAAQRDVHGADVERVARSIEDDAETLWLVLAGEDAEGWRAILEAASRDAARPLLRVALGALATSEGAEAEETAIRLVRAARLTRALPVLDLGAVQGDIAPPIVRFLETVAEKGGGAVVLLDDVERVVNAAPVGRTCVMRRGLPVHAEVAAEFRAAASTAGLDLSAGDADRLAQTFPLTTARIEDAARLVVLEGGEGAKRGSPAESLAAACRRIATPDLPRFARRVEPAFSLSDVVLPDDRRSQLEEIVGHVRDASLVMNAWGFNAQVPYGRGVAALFSGPSGTGKTMAAHAIARELRTETYVVDLARVVSKYIGESEKNLDAVFADAERAGAVLLFDEADALFGKRSEIKDAHDRYANIEVAYLLQRIESFSGLAILTTNFRQNLDQAFVRRLRFVVEFPRPDAPAREAIWRQCLPGTAPVAGDIRLRALARRLDLTGGNIRQVTLRAAFLAAASGAATIRMSHLVDAARSELLKLGMAGAERELAALAAPAPVALPAG